MMRTTLTIDDDIAARINQLVDELEVDERL